MPRRSTSTSRRRHHAHPRRRHGRGIEREDLPLAVARHATSKIASVLDLEAIATLGFRGEALASIAAVSRLALSSRALGRPHAWRIEVEGGTVGPIAPAALAAGTTVTVEELYFNTPARRKFLRTKVPSGPIATKRSGASRSRSRRSASRCSTTARCTTGAGRGRQARAEALLGDEFVLHAARMDERAGDLTLEGFAVRPAYAAGPGGQYCSSTAATCATECSRTRCAKRIATCCTTIASRPMRCGSPSIRAGST
jgi:DNA mismatch repair protein MutL